MSCWDPSGIVHCGVWFLQFVTSLKDNLNAEVVLETVTNVKEASTWLGYTYLFVRILKNPLVYGMSWEEVRILTTDSNLNTVIVFSFFFSLISFILIWSTWNVRWQDVIMPVWGFCVLLIFLMLQAMIHPGLTAKREALIIDAARELANAKMMSSDEKSGNLYVNDLGRVSSHFCIQYTTVETYKC